MTSQLVILFILTLSGAMTEQNVDLRPLSDRNHINDRCTKYTEPEMFGSHLISVSGEIAGVFRNYI